MLVAMAEKDCKWPFTIILHAHTTNYQVRSLPAPLPITLQLTAACCISTGNRALLDNRPDDVVEAAGADLTQTGIPQELPEPVLQVLGVPGVPVQLSDTVIAESRDDFPFTLGPPLSFKVRTQINARKGRWSCFFRGVSLV